MAATTFQSDESGVKSPSSPGQSQSVSPPWSSIVKGPPVMVSDAVSPAPVSLTPSPTISPFSEEQTSNGNSDWCPPSTVPEILTSPDDSGTEGQASEGGGGGSNASKKPVWNKPSNGVFEAVSPVMDAVSWPALGELKSSPKSPSSESLKALADAPLPPASQLVTEASSPSPHKPTTPNKKTSTSTQNNPAPAKQRSMKRGGGSVNSYASATSQDLLTIPQNASGRPNTATVESSPKGGFVSQSHNGNDHQHQRNTYKRSNSGPHSHGYGGKRDQDREWNQHSRSFNGRDTQRGYSRGYVRPSVHTHSPFIPPQMPLLRPFGNNIMYPDLQPPVFYYQGAPPLVGPPVPPPMYFVPDPMLYARIVTQIDYYFSNDNLVKDTYLRKNMDEQGWVPVSLIAGFKKVLYLTDNIQLILDAMRASSIVEVQGDKIRRRNDWMRWLMQPPGGNQDALASQLQGVSLDDVTPAIHD